MNCLYCGREFDRKYNLRRHEDDYCPSRENDVADCDDEMPIRKKYRHTESDEEMSSSSHNEDSSENDEDSSENSGTDDESDDEDKIDPWVSLIDDAASGVRVDYEKLTQAFITDGQEESAAKKKAYEKILPKLQKELADVYVDNLIWMKELRKDPVHKKIMATRDTFVNEDMFGPDEALSAAVDKRKFLLKQLLENRKTFPSYSDESDASA